VDVIVRQKDGDKIFSYGVIHRSSDCFVQGKFGILQSMSILAPIEVSAAEKLELLQRVDRYRQWQSLDDKRYCLVCGQVIEGRDILIVGGTRGTGPLRMICPTRGCHSIPMDWVIPTDEVLARLSRIEEKVSRPKPAPVRGKFTQRLLLKLAKQFRPAA
jgi:hypothetical protein